MTKAFRSVTLFSLLCFLTLGVAWGQQPTLNPADSQFTQNFGTDSINLQNLSVSVNAPVIHKPGAIPFGYDLVGLSNCQNVTDGHVPTPAHYAVCGLNLNKVYNETASLLTGVGSGGNAWTAGYTRSVNAGCAADNASETI